MQVKITVFSVSFPSQSFRDFGFTLSFFALQGTGVGDGVGVGVAVDTGVGVGVPGVGVAVDTGVGVGVPGVGVAVDTGVGVGVPGVGVAVDTGVGVGVPGVGVGVSGVDVGVEVPGVGVGDIIVKLLNFTTKTSEEFPSWGPFKVSSYAPTVVGKLGDPPHPTAKTLPLESTAKPLPSSK